MAEPTIPDERVLEVLRASSVFGSLEEHILRDLAGLLELQFVPGGNIVYREGEQANTMFFVICGRLRVSRRDKDGALQLYDEIRPGESVGEAGLILQQPRAADITALRDSTLAMLSRADFERVLIMHPLALNRVFAGAIYNHLRHATRIVESRRAQIFVVVALAPGSHAHEVARSLTRAFALIGAQYACDVPLDEIRDRTVRFARGGERPTIPVISIVSGRRVERDRKRMFGERRVDASWRPFFAVACNLSRAGTTAQDTGPLWRAVLARLSARRTMRRFFQRGAPSAPGIGDILYRASHIGGLHQRPRTIAQSDHYLEPPVASFPLMGYSRAEKIVEVGYRYAVKEIEQWHRQPSPDRVA